MSDKVVRLSDIEEMLANAQIVSDGEYNGYCTEDVNLSMLPTADYASVVHAHWIEHKWAEELEGLLISNYECSHCHMWLRDDRQWCGECGAKMDEESEEGKDGIR